MKRFKILLLAAVVLLSAAGPGSFYAYKWYQDSQKKYQTVRVAESRPGVYKLPHYLALKKNFYRDQYVKVRQVDCLDDREALAALENGQADVALVNPSSLVFKRAAELKKGVGPLAFASLDLGTNYHLVARENKPLADMQSLKNKTVIAGTQDSLETMFLEITMREAGFNPYEAVTIITNIPPEIRLGALKAGTGHYLLLEEKDLPAALAGGLFPVKSFKAGFPSFVCVSARQFMDQQPEALQRLTNGLYLAQSWLRHHSPGEAASAVGSLEGLDKKELPGLVFWDSNVPN